MEVLKCFNAFPVLIFIALEFLGAGQLWKCQDTLRDVAVERFPAGIRRSGNLERLVVLVLNLHFADIRGLNLVYSDLAQK